MKQYHIKVLTLLDEENRDGFVCTHLKWEIMSNVLPHIKDNTKQIKVTDAQSGSTVLLINFK